MERKRGKTIRSEARNIIRRVIRKCDEESRKNQMLIPLKQSTARAAEYVGVSERSIVRIRKEDANTDENQLLASPGKKRPRREDTTFHYSQEDQKVIRDTVYDFYVNKKIVPTGPKILEAIKEKIEFPWSVHSLYRVLRRIGFKWRNSNSIRKVLIEKPSIVAWRGKYIKSIQEYRAQNRNIIYLTETWVDSSLRFSKCWQHEDASEGSQGTSFPLRLLILHAGGRNGFVQSAEMIYKVTNSQMNATNFEKWIKEKLLPNIPAKSVIVMDNAPYHSVQLNRPPSKYAKKEDMVKWLVENNIPHAKKMRKHELIDLVDNNKKVEKVYKIDELIKLHGHDTLRLPPYMPELNPIELVWAQIKNKLKTEENSLELTINELENFMDVAMKQITLIDWEMYCSCVENLEKDYWQRDWLIEEIMDNMQLQSDSESEYEEDSSSSE
ncbi:uncharacterized protein LOC116425591 [Nomia melanderi]|uniref:uncharacterized protein LOC116425591 n=1 Tax=Nomia melanderi TaxID=2448451 RepID=UPI0013042718|nr:uncharacterized protein LOC116425591 [Nomia melanderi]XP_031829398.1 uncharacterized protein LOC116425591 [Nomia melanderi]XP_031829399.1 uncharacterized protein LOC116425591 [Nomia melanderi]